MILVADSGATKTDWLFIDATGNILHSFQGPGINPMVQTGEQITASLLSLEILQQIAPVVQEVYFYGAGCSESSRNATVSSALGQVLPASSIQIGHDLTGAVIALCGDEPGFACILGTGSNSVLFDGKEEVKKVPSLGWALGDEASGAWFGKRLMRDYCYLQLPAAIHRHLEEELKINKEDILQAVYKKPNPNRYLAGFMPVLSTFRSEGYVQLLLQKGFEEFVRFHLACYEDHTRYPANFVGSVALYFREELEKACGQYGIRTGKFVQRPVEEIAAYLVKKRQV